MQVDMLLKMHRHSHHAARQQPFDVKIEEEERKSDYRGTEAAGFKEYSGLIIKKYVDKMENLHKMETALE
jgi:hypothetical protein